MSDKDQTGHGVEVDPDKIDAYQKGFEHGKLDKQTLIDELIGEGGLSNREALFYDNK